MWDVERPQLKGAGEVSLELKIWKHLEQFDFCAKLVEQAENAALNSMTSTVYGVPNGMEHSRNTPEHVFARNSWNKQKVRP